ncbi:hypothetical protein Gotur_033511 [Gossypium turneri]
MQIVIGFIVSSRLIFLELICTPKIGGGEYNLKDSGWIHALVPYPISSFYVRVPFVCLRFSSSEICSNKPDKELQMQTLQNSLRGNIDGKKYVLVLDDVWNDDLEKWFSLKTLLLDGANGSLSRNESWSLLKQMACKEESLESNDSHLKAIRIEIAEKCGGVPLTLREIGRLSYDHLPSHLKQCFAYYSLIPKDTNFRVKRLIRYWMAQGFIQRTSGNDDDLEDAGHDYFKDLLWRNFFQADEED